MREVWKPALSDVHHISSSTRQEGVHHGWCCDTRAQIYYYDIPTDQWEYLPPYKHIQGKLQIINSKLTIIGGWDRTTNKPTSDVLTYINNDWTNHYPNLLRARVKPGVVSHSEYVIVASGGEDGSDDIIKHKSTRSVDDGQHSPTRTNVGILLQHQ